MTKREFLDTVFALAPNEANAIMDAFDEYVDSNEPHRISVTERLPDELELVIMTVYRTDKSYNQRPYIRIGFRRSEMWYPIPQESAPFGRDLSSYDGGNPVVTAWMPLSEPYQKGEQDDR